MDFVSYLRHKGYIPFRGQVRGRVYTFFNCPHPRKGRWYVHKKLKSFQCIGCAWQCETDDASDFQLFLPMEDEDFA